MIKNELIIGVFTVLSGLSLVQADVFTALTDVEKLIDIEGELIWLLRGFVLVHERKINDMKQRLERYEKVHKDTNADLMNPLYAYLLTKRLSIDWNTDENQMWAERGTQYMNDVSECWGKLELPTQEDLHGAAKGLIHLQHTYELETNSIAKGIINGKQYNLKMSSSDCFELGQQSFIAGDNQNAIIWMEEAMERLANETKIGVDSASRVDILEILANVTYQQGDVEIALSLTEEILKLNPRHEKALENKVVLKLEMSENQQTPSIRPTPPKVEPDKTQMVTDLLCRGKLKPSPATLRPLRCRYVSRGLPFLNIAPFKAEEILLDPPITVFYDVLSDNEIESIKTYTVTRLERSGVQYKNTNLTIMSPHRISKFAWFEDYEVAVGKAISKRIEDMTGLTTEKSEDYQVVNYGIGGFYIQHLDFMGKEGLSLIEDFGSGDRIATVLFYMSDVEQGGATVFPVVSASVPARKGSALLWYNLHKSGEPDYRTLHAGCPVLIGTKWVVNKWLHEGEQTFRRPCGLNDDTLLPGDLGEWAF